jgi:hypothetical protein
MSYAPCGCGILQIGGSTQGLGHSDVLRNECRLVNRKQCYQGNRHETEFPEQETIDHQSQDDVAGKNRLLYPTRGLVLGSQSWTAEKCVVQTALVACD